MPPSRVPAPPLAAHAALACASAAAAAAAAADLCGPAAAAAARADVIGLKLGFTCAAAAAGALALVLGCPLLLELLEAGAGRDTGAGVYTGSLGAGFAAADAATTTGSAVVFAAGADALALAPDAAAEFDPVPRLRLASGSTGPSGFVALTVASTAEISLKKLESSSSMLYGTLVCVAQRSFQ